MYTNVRKGIGHFTLYIQNWQDVYKLPWKQYTNILLCLRPASNRNILVWLLVLHSLEIIWQGGKLFDKEEKCMVFSITLLKPHKASSFLVNELISSQL